MSQKSTLIYKISNLKVNKGNNNILDIGRLKIHRGTIYGIVGPAGSGKTTLLNVLSNKIKQSSGSLNYDDDTFKTNLFGKPLPHPDIKHVRLDDKLKSRKVSKLFKKGLSDQTLSSYLSKNTKNSILNRSSSTFSKGEIATVNMLIGLDADPRVLLVDDYGIFFDINTERKFYTKLLKMNKDFGTTIILSSPNDINIKSIAPVLIYLDNGHISKIRSGNSTSYSKSRPRKKYNNRSTQKRNS